MRKRAGFVCVALAAVTVAGQPALKEDVPTARAPRAGSVRGAVLPADRVSRLYAVSRVTGKTYAPESFDKKTGQFLFKNLPGDATYDIGVRTTDGRTIEGIDLEFQDARLLRLARKRREELKLPPERSHKFGQDDVAELLKFVRDMKDFMDLRRVLYIRGHGRRAVMLLELMRTRQFHASGGAIIWRVELWYFENQFGGWEKLPNQERVLRRERITPRQWGRISVEYTPRLSVYVEPTGFAKPLKYTIAAKPEKVQLATALPLPARA